MHQLSEKIAMVTGGATGIGAVTAELLAAAGATVVITDIDVEGGRQCTDRIVQSGGRACYKELDATSEQAWERVIDEIMNEFSGLDVLINNAGIFRARPIEDTSIEEWHEVVDTNMDCVFLGMKQGVRAMKERARNRPSGCGGSIINVSSISARSGTPCALAYTASKAAVAHMSKSAAMEFCALEYNIRVNAVLPGMIQTSMLDRLMQEMAALGAFGARDTEQLQRIATELHPLGRLGNADEIAKGILFLASDDSSYMTGAELIIDGGYIAR